MTRSFPNGQGYDGFLLQADYSNAIISLIKNSISVYFYNETTRDWTTMTIDTNDDKKEPDIIYNAIQMDEQKPDDSRPTGAVAGPPIPEGHERFYCSQCNAHYDLPNRATSWRCQTCHHFNSITPGECEWCTIL